MPSEILRINGVVPESSVDGPGLRYVLFVQGCPHCCPGCHNPKTHDFHGGYEADIDKLFSDIKENPLLSGITFSGGEPMCQAGMLCILAKKVKTLGLEIAIYSGYTFEELLSDNHPERMALLGLCDVLVDGRFELDKRDLSLSFRGSSNQRIIDLPESLKTKNALLLKDEFWLGEKP